MHEEKSVAHLRRVREREPDGLPSSDSPWNTRRQDEAYLVIKINER